jgi:hypothetical protein
MNSSSSKFFFPVFVPCRGLISLTGNRICIIKWIRLKSLSVNNIPPFVKGGWGIFAKRAETNPPMSPFFKGGFHGGRKRPNGKSAAFSTAGGRGIWVLLLETRRSVMAAKFVN